MQLCKCLFYGYGSAIWVLHGPATSFTVMLPFFWKIGCQHWRWLSVFLLKLKRGTFTLGISHSWDLLNSWDLSEVMGIPQSAKFQTNSVSYEFDSLEFMQACRKFTSFQMDKKRRASTRGTCLSKIVSWTLGTCKTHKSWPMVWPILRGISTFEYVLDYATKMKSSPISQWYYVSFC